VLDTDTVFHGVDPVGGPTIEPPPVTGDAEIRRLDDDGGRWLLVDTASGEERATYDWDELRLSGSWKAYCFGDEADREPWRTHRDDLSEDVVIDTLIADLVASWLVGPDPARDGTLGASMIETYVRYPSP